MRKCTVCHKMVSKDIIEKHLQCLCDQNFVLALKTKIQSNQASDKNFENCITEEQQTDISGNIERHLQRYNLEPPDPGLQIDMTHLCDEIKFKTEKLITDYEEAFACHKYDTGHFEGFTATIEIKEGSSVIEKERPMRQSIKNELKPMIQKLLSENII